MAQNTFPMPDLLRTGSEERLRLEPVVNMLLELGLLRENLEIIAEGGFRRFQGEIIRQSPEPGTQVGSDTKVTLWVTQEGIADNLPESLFAFSGFLDRKEPAPKHPAKDFFMPLDSLFFQTSALLHRIAQVYGLLFPDSEFSRYFLTMFGFPEPGWDREELSVWQAILPYASGWIGTRWGIEAAARVFSGLDVKVVENVSHSTDMPEEMETRLGRRSSRLGIDCLLGDRFEDTDSACKVVVGPVPIERLAALMPGGEERQKLERILSLCTPGDLDYEIELTLDQEDRKFVPGEGPAYNLLGYSTWI